MKKNINVLLLLLVTLLLISGCAKPLNVIAYGDDERQVMDIILPDELASDEQRPVILYIHGGGWTAGDKSNFSHMQQSTIDAGYIYASMNYHYAGDGNNYLTLINDIKLAIDFLYNQQSVYHVDPRGIALIGASAGAHLALLYAYKEVSSAIPISLVVSQVGPTDFTDYSITVEDLNPSVIGMISNLMNKTYDIATFSEHQSDADLIDASPITHVDEHVPPTIMAYGMLDELVPYSNATRLDERLTLYGVAHALITFENSGHGLNDDRDQTEQALYLSTLVHYLHLYLPKQIV